MPTAPLPDGLQGGILGSCPGPGTRARSPEGTTCLRDLLTRQKTQAHLRASHRLGCRSARSPGEEAQRWHPSARQAETRCPPEREPGIHFSYLIMKRGGPVPAPLGETKTATCPRTIAASRELLGPPPWPPPPQEKGGKAVQGAGGEVGTRRRCRDPAGALRSLLRNPRKCGSSPA